MNEMNWRKRRADRGRGGETGERITVGRKDRRKWNEKWKEAK